MPHVTITELSITTTSTILGLSQMQTRTVNKTTADATFDALKNRLFLSHSLKMTARASVEITAIIKEHSVAQLAARLSRIATIGPN